MIEFPAHLILPLTFNIATANAPVSQIKEAFAKYRAARKEKQARLEAAQASLRSVLNVKQEAQAVLLGLLS